MTSQQGYPALIVGWLTPVYDLFARLLIRETKLKRALTARADLKPGQRVLDVGAGTGTLAIMLKRAQPEAEVIGLDRDPQVLTIASGKASRAGVNVAFGLGSATALPYAAEAFDQVLSSLVFSLLEMDEKRRAVGEAHRVLRAKGELHVADFGPPNSAWAHRVAPLVLRFGPIAGNLQGRLPAMFRETGFDQVEAAPCLETLFGSLWTVSGRKGE